jgi:sulfatase modifying factor 1
MKYIKTIIMVIISISLNSICFAESISKAGNILIRSLPIECELSLDGNLPKDKINIKGGVFVPYPSDKWGIKKADDILYINNIPEGKYNITFKKGDKEIAFAVDIQDGKTCFVKCNFIKNKVLGTGQIYVGKDGYPMVSIPAGDFLMGSDNGDPDESPIHKVYLDAFYIDIYEVTNSQYKKFIDATGHKPPRFWNDPKCNAPDQPVVGVIYQDAMDYCKWAGKRLPTEAEWEKSARGGLVSKEYPWGDEEIANPGLENENPGLSSAVTVGRFDPNGYGLYDMERNAWEWCADWYGEEYYANSPEKNPKGLISGDKRILRGGSWFSGIYTPQRIAYRYSLEPDQTSYLIGFRCVQDVE